ncbi:hypothetical protein BVRB_8g193530 [Beta vulgaris subsp. vulgaris]|nr:hypothetical protein BVRB_8g193530 [Beta vulgaris subsp. vulgaris]
MIGYEVQDDVVLFGMLINASAESGNVTDAIDYIGALKRQSLTFLSYYPSLTSLPLSTVSSISFSKLH